MPIEWPSLDDLELEIEVPPQLIRRETTFSEEAFLTIGPIVTRWAAEQVMAYWNQRNVPPTRMVIKAQIEVQ